MPTVPRSHQLQASLLVDLFAGISAATSVLPLRPETLPADLQSGIQGKVPDALQHAREAAEAAAAARDLLKSPFAGLTPDGFSIPEGNVQGRLQAPDTSLDEDSGFQGPNLNNPLDRFSDSGYGNGMNIRENASDSRKGTGGHNPPHVSLRSRTGVTRLAHRTN